MTIRLARLEDATDLARLHSASFEEGWSESDFLTWLARAEGFAAVTTHTIPGHECEAIAFGLALAAGEDAELLSIAVMEANRRDGLGRQIVEALDAEAQQRGLKRWVLEVSANNLAACRLYKSTGFVAIGVRTAYYRTRDGRADALVLSRPVGGVSGHRRG